MPRHGPTNTEPAACSQAGRYFSSLPPLVNFSRVKHITTSAERWGLIDAYVGYRLHALTAIDAKTGHSFPLVSLLARANYHDSHFLPFLVKLVQAMGLDIKLITDDEACHDKNGSLFQETGAIVTSPHHPPKFRHRSMLIRTVEPYFVTIHVALPCTWSVLKTRSMSTNAERNPAIVSIPPHVLNTAISRLIVDSSNKFLLRLSR
jgi:hypothetical protein